MPLNKDSNFYIIGFAAAVCVVCSIFVSGAAVSLKEKQKTNAQLDLQKNVISVAGFEGVDTSNITPDQIDNFFKSTDGQRIVAKYLDLPKGSTIDTLKTLEEVEAHQLSLKGKCDNDKLENNLAKLRCYQTHQKIYEVYQDSKMTRVILPVEGKGLWSTLKGFLAVEKDGNTIAGLTFYSHAETPGLGGEIDNPDWKGSWVGKKAYKGDMPAAMARKGGAKNLEYEVDGLSGATLTCNGVNDMMNFWLGEHGYGNYLSKLKGGS